jgi:hypothetical protein
MSVSDEIEAIVSEFKADPRNKVFVEFGALLKSANEETGKKLKADKLKDVIQGYIEGELGSADEQIYDGAVAICGAVARGCWADNEDDDVDYEISWIEKDDGTYSAELRPN